MMALVGKRTIPTVQQFDVRFNPAGLRYHMYLCHITRSKSTTCNSKEHPNQIVHENSCSINEYHTELDTRRLRSSLAETVERHAGLLQCFYEKRVLLRLRSQPIPGAALDHDHLQHTQRTQVERAAVLCIGNRISSPRGR